jgi:hypothetical protein
LQTTLHYNTKRTNSVCAIYIYKSLRICFGKELFLREKYFIHLAQNPPKRQDDLFAESLFSVSQDLQKSFQEIFSVATSNPLRKDGGIK